MQQDNKHIDKKFQELENQSLPELSKMDEHWQQMKLILQPGIVPAKKVESKKYLRWMIAAILIGATFLVTYKLINSTKTGTTINDKTTQQPLIPAKTTTDTALPSNLVNKKDNGIQGSQKPALVQPRKILKARIIPDKDTTIQLTIVTNTVDPPSIDESASLNMFFKKLEKQAQEFVINNKRDTVITGREGTALLIPANSFNTTGEVVIAMKEFYTYEDIITNKLSTSSNGEQLITGGMIHLMATVNGKEVNIQPGKSIRWFVPDTSSSLSQMQLFTGEAGSTNRKRQALNSENLSGFFDQVMDTAGESGSLEIMNWVPDNRKFISTYLVTSVKVLDLSNEPYKTRYTRKGVKGLFHISDNPKISREELGTELKERYGYYKVRFKKNKRSNSLFLGLFRRTLNWESYADVGDSSWMSDQIAKKYKLNATDTMTYLRSSMSYGGGSYVKKTFANINLNALANRFSVDIRKMGWVNCDMFYNDNKPKTDYYVDLKDTAVNYYTVLVFDRIKSMVRGQVIGNKVGFFGVPKGESAKLICVGIQNGKTVAAMESLPANGTTITNLKFEETNPAAFKEQAGVMDK